LNRVSEDGVMPTWVREPHRKYGTSYRLINLIVLLQIVAIVGSRGETYTLGEAYAFGVIWSFAFKALAVAVLRFKDPSPREWKVPFNITLNGYELPLGLGSITAVLFILASVNLLTKEVATISGIGFTGLFGTLVTNAPIAFYLTWQLLTVAGCAIIAICMLSAILSCRKVIKLEPAVVFKG